MCSPCNNETRDTKRVSLHLRRAFALLAPQRAQRSRRVVSAFPSAAPRCHPEEIRPHVFMRALRAKVVGIRSFRASRSAEGSAFRFFRSAAFQAAFYLRLAGPPPPKALGAREGAAADFVRRHTSWSLDLTYLRPG